MGDIATLITNFGFPIVACVGMGWYIKYVTDKHNTEIDKITKALNNNTLALQKLVDKLDVRKVEE